MSYKMPEVFIGDDVYWYPDGDLTQRPHSARVTAVGIENVCLNIFSPRSATFILRDGVRHVSDPRSKLEAMEAGVWDLRQVGKQPQQQRQESNTGKVPNVK